MEVIEIGRPSHQQKPNYKLKKEDVLRCVARGEEKNSIQQRFTATECRVGNAQSGQVRSPRTAGDQSESLLEVQHGLLHFLYYRFTTTLLLLQPIAPI